VDRRSALRFRRALFDVVVQLLRGKPYPSVYEVGDPAGGEEIRVRGRVRLREAENGAAGFWLLAQTADVKAQASAGYQEQTPQ